MNKEHQRNTGAFYTPTIWADECHKDISRFFGADWKDEYTVWDCAAGEGALVKDYTFSNLYVSTLDQPDVDYLNNNLVNPSTIFQYDFLNEVNIDSVPDGLKNSIEGGDKVMFFINPPYGRPGSGTLGSIHCKTSSNVNDSMKSDKMGIASAQLYAQFMYKIAKLKERNDNIALALISPPAYMTLRSYRKFYTFFSRRFESIYGFMLDSTQFGVDMGSPIAFTLWR